MKTKYDLLLKTRRMMNAEKQQLRAEAYEAPRVECIEVSIEAGFQASIGGSGTESYDTEDGAWETL